MRMPVNFNDECIDGVDIIVNQDEFMKMVEQGKITHSLDEKVFALDYEIGGEFTDRIVDGEPSGESYSLKVDLIFVRVYKSGLYSITGCCKQGGLEFFTELLNY